MDLSASSSPSGSSSSEDDNDSQEIYDVEFIRTWRYNRRTKSREYFIKWRNWPEDDNTWEPEAHLSCPEPMTHFLASMSRRQRKLYNAENLDHLSGLQRNAGIVHIFAEMKRNTAPGSPNGSLSGNDTDEGGVNSRAKFVLRIQFDDDDECTEIVTMEELMKYKPDKAFEWIEQRLTFRTLLEGRSDLLVT